MSKKATKKPKAAAAPRAKRLPASTPLTTPVAAAATTTTAARVAKPRPVARMRRATASPAQRRGADLVRYLRIHQKHPYGDRGIRALVTLAREVAHLGLAELNATVSPEN